MDEPSSISRPVAGSPPSGLTDAERYCLADLSVERVMADMDVSEDTARALLSHAAGEGRVTVSGDRHTVGLFIDDRPLFVADRVRLRAVVHPEQN